MPCMGYMHGRRVRGFREGRVGEAWEPNATDCVVELAGPWVQHLFDKVSGGSIATVHIRVPRLR
jgi:hypothetical protein